MNFAPSTGIQEYTHHRRLLQESGHEEFSNAGVVCGASPKATRVTGLTDAITGICVGSEDSPPDPNSNGANCEVRAVAVFRIGGRYKDRTCDPFHVKEVLYR